MTKIFDIIDEHLYTEMVNGGFIKVQKHPDPEVPYLIHNYTDATTWEQMWNEATLQCRGLITHADTGEIIARGMPKFFNSDQEQAPVFALDDEVIVSDKLDGSLGIMYLLPNHEWAIATRGSFTSDQAIWATKWFKENTPTLMNVGDATYVFEIIYPENRIVVNYGDKEGLVLLGWVENATGKFTPGWVTGTDCATQYSYTTWSEVLEAPERDNAEGFVVTRKSDGAMVKIKYEDYKRLHKYMTRVTERHVWEVVMVNGDLQKEFEGSPDEFHYWVYNTAHSLLMRRDDEYMRLKGIFRKVYDSVENPTDRKSFAMVAANHPEKAALFLLYEGRDIVPLIWKRLKPEAKTFKTVSSDAD